MKIVIMEIATTLMELMLETLPKIYVLPTKIAWAQSIKRYNSSSVVSIQRAQIV
jgi:hypothetical protein